MKKILLSGLMILMIFTSTSNVFAANKTIYIDGQSWNHLQKDFSKKERDNLSKLGVISTFINNVDKLHVNWHKPTDGNYPDIKKTKNLNIYVDLKKQRVYIKDGSKTIYEMICSSGTGDNTPKGDFAIEPERGKNFFNPNLNEGANYWTSFKDHGIYLFHTVPTVTNGSYNEKEAMKLGTKASHGCVRLSIADAKWINDYVPGNTKVKVA